MRKRRRKLHTLIHGKEKKLHRNLSQCVYSCPYGRIKGNGDSIARTEAPMNSVGDKRDYIAIYESEVRVIAGIASLYGKIECSMNLFGLWTRGGRLVILLILAPGPRAIQRAFFCEQDIEFFRQASEIIETKLGIQWDGEAHSHYSIGMPAPSYFDVEQVQRVTSRNQFCRWAELITTFDNGDYTSRGFGRRRRDAVRWENSLQVKVCGFSYTDPQRGQKVPAPLRVLPGISPVRLRVLADGILGPADIGQYACDFPMDQIIYEPFDFEKEYCGPRNQIPESLALTEQCEELPDEAQSDIAIHVNEEQDLVTVTMPLPDGSTAHVGYSHTAPHLIDFVCVQDNHDANIKDVTELLFPDKRDLTLNQIYKLLVLSKQRDTAGRVRDDEVAQEIPESFTTQVRELPEGVRRQVGFRVEQDFVVVTLPLPDGRIVEVNCEKKQPHSLRSVYVHTNDDQKMKDLPPVLLAPGSEITLNRVHEILVAQTNRR